MTESIIEEWMHASEEDRANFHEKWNVKNGEGKEILDEVKGLFKEECIYGVMEVEVSNDGEHWSIEAFVSEDDFEHLRDRYNISFLGFKVNFNNINDHTP